MKAWYALQYRDGYGVMHTLPKHITLVTQPAALLGSHHDANKTITNVLIQNEQLAERDENFPICTRLTIV